MAGMCRLWFYISVIIATLYFVAGQDPDCDYYQDVALGSTYYVYSPGYPNLYTRPKTCRWQSTCPINTRCRLRCSVVSLPRTTSCTGDRILVSKTGDALLTGADKYCGTGTLDITSTSNKISVDNNNKQGFGRLLNQMANQLSGLVAVSSNSPGGRFLCSLNAVVSPTTSTRCTCGWKKTTRIVGGEETIVNEFPSMVGLVDVQLRIISCGGTIISPFHVLTAAHCFNGMSPSTLSVLYGDHNTQIGTEAPEATLLRVQRLIIHPSYRSSSNDYDIGIAVTEKAMIFSERVGPACLPFNYASSTFAGSYVDVLGWGTTSFGGAASDFLRKVKLQVISSTSCRSSLGSAVTVTSRMMCTFMSGKDACQRDSGGPLLWTNPNNGRLYLVGIIVGGIGCATSKPGLNTRVASYLSWISSNTAGTTLCRI